MEIFGNRNVLWHPKLNGLFMFFNVNTLRGKAKKSISGMVTYYFAFRIHSG